MSRYTSITVIYNPKSTGGGRKLATEFEAKFRIASPKEVVSLMRTEFAGHAEILAYEIAIATERPLIISASGDGGYHEVVNGLMKAKLNGANPVAGLLPAGNANDHFRSLHEGDIVEAIMRGNEHTIDLLRLRAVSDGQPLEHYAHSYIGVGFTPRVGAELNKIDLNALREGWIVIRSLLTWRPVQLKVNNRLKTYDSLIFSNVPKMSKVLTLSKKAAPDDGKFEITAHYHHSNLQFFASLVKASLLGVNTTKQAQEFSFETIKPTLVQLDGEVKTIDTNSKTIITLEQKVLRCVV